MMRVRPSLSSAWQVTLVFAAVAVAATWPLAWVMRTRIADDIGDPVFVSWAMMWTGGQVLRFLSGDFHALADYWNGNIFYPERLTVAYSEHLTPQMLQILPVFAATHNIVLCYNLLFLSAIVLSALGMYLFVRELTGQPVAGFVAGMAFAFAPYRAAQFSHLHVLSSQWMPFALYGILRYFETGRARALAGATAAVVVQALSCGYYLFFFTPFAAAFCVFECFRRGAWRRGRTWWQLGAAAAVGLMVLWPFVRPYLAVRANSEGLGHRSLKDVQYYSADTWSLATAPDNLAFWGRLQAHRRPEGAGFPGLAILSAGAVGALAVAGAAAARSRRERKASRRSKTLAVLLSFAGLALIAGWIRLLVWQGVVFRGSWGRIRVRSIDDLGWYTLGVIAIGVIAVPRFRRFVREFVGSRGGFIILAWLTAVLLAFGPAISVQGKEIGAGPYLLLYKFVPGFDGFRVPPRFFMIAALFLAALGGIGVAMIARRNRTLGYAIAFVLAFAMVIEGREAPFLTSKRLWAPHYADVETTFPTPPNLGAVYDAVTALPAGTVLAELPFGDDAYDTRAMYFAGYHRKPIINGYSGFFPASNSLLKFYLQGDPADKGAAWRAMLAAGVTHVLVHERPWPDHKGPLISSWIRNSGGREIAAAETDRLFAIREP